MPIRFAAAIACIVSICGCQSGAVEVPYREYRFEQTVRVSRRIFGESLGAQVGGLRLELVSAKADQAGLLLFVVGQAEKKQVSIAAASSLVVFEDYEVIIERIVGASWWSRVVELRVRGLPCPDAVFAAIPDSLGPNRCTPKEMLLSGIRINAPRSVALEATQRRGRAGESLGFAKVMVAGTWRFNSHEMKTLGMLGMHPERALTVHVTKEGEQRESASGLDAFIYIPNEVPPPPNLVRARPSEAPSARYEVQAFFNIDIGAMVAFRPDSPGSYRVWVGVGEHRSNEVVIRIASR